MSSWKWANQRARRSSVRGRPLAGLATALGLPEGPQVTHGGGVDHDDFARALELHIATRRQLGGDARERLLDDDRVVLREDDAGLFRHEFSLTQACPGTLAAVRPSPSRPSASSSFASPRTASAAG